MIWWLLFLLCQASFTFSAILLVSCNPLALPIHVSKEGLACLGGSAEYFRYETIYSYHSLSTEMVYLEVRVQKRAGIGEEHPVF